MFDPGRGGGGGGANPPGPGGGGGGGTPSAGAVGFSSSAGLPSSPKKQQALSSYHCVDCMR